MEFLRGDWVRTAKGTEGMVFLANRVVAYVAIYTEWQGIHLRSYLVSQLTKLEQTEKSSESSM
jgi:hypothetical protein